MNESISDLIAEAAHRLTIQDTERSSDDYRNEGGSQKYKSENEGSNFDTPNAKNSKPERDHQVICPIDIQKATSSNQESHSSNDKNYQSKKMTLLKKDEDDHDILDSLNIPSQATRELPQMRKYTSSPPVQSKGFMTVSNPSHDNPIRINLMAAIGAGTGSPFTNNSQKRRRQTMMPRMSRFGMVDQASDHASDDLMRQRSQHLPIGFTSPLKMAKYNFMSTLNNSKKLKSNSLFKKQQSFLSRADSIKTLETGQYTNNLKRLPGQLQSNFKFTLNAYEDELEKMAIKRLKTKKVIKSQNESNLQSQTIDQNAKLSKLNTHGRYIHQNKSQVLNQIVDGHENLILKNQDHNKKRREQLQQQILNQKLKNIQRKSGFNEIPKILIEQSKKHLRNKNVLNKFMKPLANKGQLKRMISRNLNKKSYKEDEKLGRSSSFRGEKKLTRSITNGSPGLSKKGTFKDEMIQSQQVDISDNISIRSDKSSMPLEKQVTKSEAEDQFSDMDEQDEFIEQNKKSSVGSTFLVMFPDSTIRASWDIFVFVSIVYQGIMMPMRISFEMETPQWLFYLEVCIDIMFLLDIVLNFNTGFYKQGQLIMSRKQIAVDYIQTWLFIDLISSLPYTWFLAWAQGVSIQSIESDDQESQLGALANTPQLLRLLKIAKLLKMLKILRVVKLKRILQKFDDMIVTDQMNLLVTFFNLTVKIIVVAHYMGCFFFYIGMDEVRQMKQGWLYQQQLLDEPFVNQYITSIYWAFTTMAAVGYGEITPITKREKNYAIFTMIVTSGIFAYTVNRIGTIISSFNQTSSIYKEKMMYVNRFMISQDIPAPLRMKVRRYLDYVFQNKKEIKLEEQEVYPLLNENLNDKIQIYLKSQILGQMNFIQDFGMDFLIELTTFFHKVTFVTDDFIFMEKDRAENIYYVIQGKIAMIHKQSHTFITDVEKDQHIGEIGFFSGQSRQLSAKSRDFTEVYRIKKEDLFGICENYIEAITAIRHIKESLDNKNYKPLKMRCYICREMDHVALKCQKFRKLRGNLMRMYAKQMNEKMKSKRASSVINKGSEKMTSESEYSRSLESEEGHVRQTFFVYQDEAQEPRLDVSMESEDDKILKEQLIKQNTGVDDIDLDGRLIEKILENPKKAQFDIKYAFVKKSFMSLDRNVNKTIAKSTSSHMTCTKQSKNSRENIKQIKTNQLSDAVIQRTLSQYSGMDLNQQKERCPLIKKNSENKISLGHNSNLHPQSEKLNQNLQVNHASFKAKHSDPTPSEKDEKEMTPNSNIQSTVAIIRPDPTQNNFLNIEQNASQDTGSLSDKIQQYRSNVSKQSKLTKINEDDKELLSQEEKESQNKQGQDNDPRQEANLKEQFETQDLRKRKAPKKQQQDEPLFSLKEQNQTQLQQSQSPIRQISDNNLVNTDHEIQNVILKHANSQQRNENKLQELIDNNSGQLNIIVKNKQQTSVNNSENIDIKYMPSGLHTSLQQTSQNEPVSQSPIEKSSNFGDYAQKATQKTVQFMQDNKIKDESKKNSYKKGGRHYPSHKQAIFNKRDDHGSSNSQKRTLQVRDSSSLTQNHPSSNYGSPSPNLGNQNNKTKFRDQIQICQEKLETIKSDTTQNWKNHNFQRAKNKQSEKNVFRDTDQNFKNITRQEQDKIRRAEIAKAYLTKEQQSTFKSRDVPKLRKGHSNPNNNIEKNGECSGDISYNSRFQQSNIDDNGRQLVYEQKGNSMTQPRKSKHQKRNAMRSQKSPEQQKEKSGNGSRVTTSMSQLGNEQAMKIFTSSAKNEDQKQPSPKTSLPNQQFTVETHNSLSEAQGEQITQFHPRDGENSQPSAVLEEQKCEISENFHVDSQQQIIQDQWLSREKSAGKSQFIQVYPDVKSLTKSQN